MTPEFVVYVFDVDHVAKIRSELSITVLEKKKNKITTEKKFILGLGDSRVNV